MRPRPVIRTASSGPSRDDGCPSSVLCPRRGTSDAGQAVWIPEKFWAWTDCDGRLSYRRPARQRHALLVTTTATSPARLYWESFGKRRTTPVVKVPTGGAGFPKEIISQHSSSRNCLCGTSGGSSGLYDSHPFVMPGFRHLQIRAFFCVPSYLCPGIAIRTFDPHI